MCMHVRYNINAYTCKIDGIESGWPSVSVLGPLCPIDYARPVAEYQGRRKWKAERAEKRKPGRRRAKKIRQREEKRECENWGARKRRNETIVGTRGLRRHSCNCTLLSLLPRGYLCHRSLYPNPDPLFMDRWTRELDHEHEVTGVVTIARFSCSFRTRSPNVTIIKLHHVQLKPLNGFLINRIVENEIRTDFPISKRFISTNVKMN